MTSHKEHDVRRREHRKQPKRCEEERNSRANQRRKNSSYDDSESDRYWSAKNRDGLDHSDSTRKRSRHSLSERSESQDRHNDRKSSSSTDSDADLSGRKREGDAELGHSTKNTRLVKKAPEGLDDFTYSKSRAYSTDKNRESHCNDTDDHWDKKNKSPRRNANGDQTAGVKDSQQANSRKSSRCLNEVSLDIDDDDDKEYKRSDEDYSGYVGSISRGPRYHTGEDIDERGRWEAGKEITKDHHGKHVESSKRKASDYSHKEHKKKHRSHHGRSDKDDS